MLSRSLPAAPAEGIPHPIDEAVELVSPARAAGNRFVMGRMLAYFLPTARAATPD